jgi:hypothetical protein
VTCQTADDAIRDMQRADVEFHAADKCGYVEFHIVGNEQRSV